MNNVTTSAFIYVTEWETRRWRGTHYAATETFPNEHSLYKGLSAQSLTRCLQNVKLIAESVS
jgi:hypothetical protein